MKKIRSNYQESSKWVGICESIWFIMDSDRVGLNFYINFNTDWFLTRPT